MLKTRVVTALLLLAVVLPSLFYLPQLHWSLLAALFFGVGAWEWGGFLGWGMRARLRLGLGFVGIAALMLGAYPCVFGLRGEALCSQDHLLPLFAGVTFFWLLLVPMWMRQKWRLGSSVPAVFVGAILLFPSWMALVQLRLLGPGVLLGWLAVVWIADIAAYFAGRAFGRRKLAPTISPGKTWEGALGAFAAVTLYLFLMRTELVILPQAGLMTLFVIAFGLTAVSIVGDLFESLLKRQAGIKDSSQVLPGHGGVLDRIDSLTSTLPVLMLVWLVLGHMAS